MKILSLFDGISCARVALEKAGIHADVYYASEIDKYAMQISQKNYPDIIQLGGVKELKTGADFGSSDEDCVCFFSGDTAFVPAIGGIDLLIGGSPCQDLSIAKKNREGLAGSRSNLFWEYVRILNEVKPKYFILENVNSMPKEAKQLITETLGVEPIMIDAALVSAQRRKRLFWVGKWNGENYEQVIVPQPEDRGILLKDILEDGDTVINPKLLNFKGDKEKCMTLTSSMYKEPPSVGTEDSIYQYRRTYWRETKGGKVPTLTANMGTGGNNVPYVPVALRNRGKGKKPEYNGTGKANSLTTVQTDSMVDIPPIRKLTPLECERLQSLPDGYTEGVSNTQRYKALGNAFNVDVIAHILKYLI